MKILIVDDASIIRMLVRDILVEFCKIPSDQIYEAADGMQGLDGFKKHKPDIVFLDIAMPKLDGISAIDRILEIEPEAKIIMCTSTGSEATVKQCMRAGAMDYLVKPLTAPRVVQAVNKVMEP